jgi:hypothetical protein
MSTFLQPEDVDEELPCIHNPDAAADLSVMDAVHVYVKCVEQHIVPQLLEFNEREAEAVAHLSAGLDARTTAANATLQANRDRLHRVSEILTACEREVPIRSGAASCARTGSAAESSFGGGSAAGGALPADGGEDTGVFQQHRRQAMQLNAAAAAACGGSGERPRSGRPPRGPNDGDLPAVSSGAASPRVCAQAGGSRSGDAGPRAPPCTRERFQGQDGGGKVGALFDASQGVVRTAGDEPPQAHEPGVGATTSGLVDAFGPASRRGGKDDQLDRLNAFAATPKHAGGRAGNERDASGASRGSGGSGEHSLKCASS